MKKTITIGEWLAQLDNLGPSAKISEYEALYDECPDHSDDSYEWLAVYISSLK